jgi:PST family polysaccharide transporter
LNSAGAVNQLKKHSYPQIFYSSLIIGGSSLITLGAQIIRTKLVAIFLGPAGLGLMGIFASTTTLVGTVTAMGIPTSSVREIADASGGGDDVRVARAVSAVRWIMVRLGLLGAFLLAVFSAPVSVATFGTADYAGQIAVLSVVIALGAIADGQTAVLQGLRQIGAVAKIAVLAAAANVVIALPILYRWRQDAVVPLLIAGSATGLAASWWYARRIDMARVPMTWRMAMRESRPLLQLGVATMSAAVMASAIAYVVRVTIARHLGFEAAGVYHAATALSGVYCGFILSAMGTDFLPRVSSVATDDRSCNRLVNEQVEVALLLALPGICATLAAAPFIVPLLYSQHFSPATDVLRWQVLGVLLRVASWPLGYLLLAKGKARLYLWTELSYNLLHALLVWVCVRIWGLPGTGIAFFGLYIYYCALMWLVTRRLSGFAWSILNKRVAAVATPAVAFVFLCPIFLPSPWDVAAAAGATALCALYSIRTLAALPGDDHPLRGLDHQMERIRAAGSRVAGFLRANHG